MVDRDFCEFLHLYFLFQPDNGIMILYKRIKKCQAENTRLKDHVKVDIYLNRHEIQLISGEIILAQNFIKIGK